MYKILPISHRSYCLTAQTLNTFFLSLQQIYKSAPLVFLLTILLVGLSGAFPAVFIKATAGIIQILSDPALRQSSSLNFYLGLWGLAIFGQSLLTPIITYLQSILADKITYHINLNLIKKANSFESIDVFDNEEFHNNLELVKNQAYHKPTNMVVTAVGLLKDLVIIFFCLLMLQNILGLKVLLMLFAAAVNAFIFVKISNLVWQDSFNRSKKSRFINYLGTLAITPKFIKEIRFFGYKQYIEKLYSQHSEQLYRESHINKKTTLLKTILPILLSVGITIFLTFTIARRVAFSGANLGDISILIGSILQLQMAINNFSEQSGWVKGHLLFFEKYFEFIRFHIIKSPTTGSLVTDIKSPINIEFKNVNFAYNSNFNALNNINLKINSGDKIAIVGANGAGKSTFIKLLCGLYLPSSGQMLINGVDITNIDLSKWRKKLSPVFQDFCNYDLTLRENISCENSKDDAKLKSILETSEIVYLEKKLEDKIGKAFGGIELSTGQWQKVAIARALYNNGDIFILDEPTASLDPISEYEIFKKFGQISANKTTIFVTHRLNSVLMADRIIFMDDGEITAHGTHSELMNHCPKYREMFEKQAGGFVELAGGF